MNRLDKLFSGVRFKSSWDSIFLKNLNIDVDDDIAKYPYKKSDLVYICVSTTSRAISQVPLKVMYKVKDTWEWVGDRDPVQQLITKPNTLTDSAEEFVSALVAYLLLDGHVFIVPYPPTGKRFDSLWVVKRDNMGVVQDEKTGQIEYWTYNPNNSTSIPLLPDEIGSIKFFNPYDTIWGFKPLDAGKLPLVNDYKAASYTSKFWDQGAVPGGVLQTEKNLTEDRIKRIRENFLSEHESYKKSHKVAVLEGGLKYQQIGLNQKDMEFIDLRKYNRDNILQIFGMKKAVISVTEDLNYATAKEERKEWWQDTNMPLMKLIEASLSNILYPNDPNRKIVFDISTVEALHDDYTKRVEIGETLMKIGFTANEINERLELGFKPKSWRDKWYMPVNMLPVTEAGVESLPHQQQPLPAPEAPKQIEYEQEEILEVKEVKDDNDQDKMFSALWKAVINKTEPIELEFASKVRRCFFDMRKKALKLVNQNKSIEKNEADLMNENFLSDKANLIKWTVPIYEDAARTGAQTLAAEAGMGLSFNINDPEVLNHLLSRPLKVVGVVDTIKNQIANDIHEGMKVNETTNQIAARIKNTFNRAQTRAMTIARTEVGASVSFGRDQQMQKMPFAKKIWITAGDEHVRESHQMMNGQSIPINQNWIVGGASLRYPGDPAGPGKESINCRCIVTVDEKSRIGTNQDLLVELPSEIEDKFAIGKIAELIKRDQDSLNETYIAVIKDDGKGLFKPIVGEPKTWSGMDLKKANMATREVAVSEIDELLGTKLVPKTVIKSTVETGKGSCQSFVEGFVPAGKLGQNFNSIMKNVPLEEYQKGSAFDYIIGHNDRHRFNWGVVDNKLVFIDNGIALTRFSIGEGIEYTRAFLTENYYNIEDYIGNLGSAEKTISTWAKSDNPFTQIVKLAAEKWEDIDKILVKHGFSEMEIRAMATRIYDLKKLIEE